MPRIFINYRREDTEDAAGRLYDVLAQRFGDNQVFMDVDKIAPGADFVEAIEQATDSSDVMVVLIGQQWLTVADRTGRRRLDRPGDFVRLEIEAALRRKIRVIPVLVQDVAMPSAEDLPHSLKPLARHNAVQLRHVSWRSDVGVLTRELEVGSPAAADLLATKAGQIDEKHRSATGTSHGDRCAGTSGSQRAPFVGRGYR